MNKEPMNIIIFDGYYYIVPVFVTDWITSVPKATGVYEDIPEQIANHFGIYDEDSKVMLNMHVYETCRALCITEYAPEFESIHELNEYINDNNYEIGKEFHYEDFR